MRAEQNPNSAVVITGGEPFLFAELGALCDRLREAGHLVHLETSGSLFAPIHADLVCVSPKLANSTPSASEHPEWSARHERARLPLDTLRQFVAHFGEKLYLKFVVRTESDLAEIHTLLAQIGFQDKSRVFLMPESQTRAELDQRAESIALLCVKTGFRYSDRLHVRIWGSELGR